MTDAMTYLMVFIVILLGVITSVPICYVLFTVLEAIVDGISSVYNKMVGHK